MRSPSVIELSSSALRRNLRYLRGFLAPETVFSAVIKGDAYGHGIAHWVPMAERAGVRHFSVFGADEAEQALKASTKGSHVMIMGYLPEEEVDWAVAHDCSFFVFDRGRLEAAVRAAVKREQTARVHLELETGLNRTGLDKRELDLTLRILAGLDGEIGMEGLCTHFAGAESSANFFRIQQQMESFKGMCNRVKADGLVPRFRHVACSAAALVYPESVCDLVRIGIASYGYWPSEETRLRVLQRTHPDAPPRQDPLARVLRWRSSVMSIKPVRPGEFVGYGNAYLTTRLQRVAAVPVGYYHGFARSLGNLGHVLVHGRRAAVVGYVNMNMMLIDITDIPGVQVGDEVVIVGRQKRAQITVGAFSDLTRDLNYEVLVRIPSSIPRKIV